MGWIIFIIYLFFGAFVNCARKHESDLIDELETAKLEIAKLESNDKKKVKDIKRRLKKASLVVNISMYIGVASLGIFLLYGIGWIWYFFCGGFLVFEDCTFWDKVVYGLISLLPLGFVIGFIAICFGWDPSKK